MPDFSPRRLAEPCSVRTVPDPPHTRLVLAGEIDIGCRSRLDAVLDEVGDGPAVDVTADLSAVTFLGSVGLDFLVQLHLRLVNAGRALTVLNPRPTAGRAIKLTGLDKLLTVVNDHDA
jgi:anti-anti-sigma factor